MATRDEVLQVLRDLGYQVPSTANDILTAGGQALGAAGAAMAGNRGVQMNLDVANKQNQLSADQLYQNEMIARQEADQAARKNAYREMLRAAYVAGNQGSKGSGLTPYSHDIAAPSADVKASADNYRDQMAYILGTESALPIPQRIDTNVAYRKPSIWEKLAGVGGVAAGIAGKFVR